MDWSAVYGAQDDSLDKLLARGQVQNSTLFKVAQELQRRKEAERQDSLAARQVDLQAENARESRAFREMQQQSLNDDRAQRAADRAAAQKSADTQRFMNSLPLRKKGSVVTPVEQVRFVQEGLTGNTTAAGSDEHMADPHFHFKGTPANEATGARLEDADAAQAERERHDLAMEEAALKTANARGAGGGMTGYQRQNLTRNLRTEYGKVMAPSIELRQQLARMESGLAEARKGNMNAGTQAVLTTFNKMLDPGSVVRESEYARSPEGMALLDRINGVLPRLTKGGVGMTPEALEQFADLARTFMANADAVAQRRVAPILMQASDAGIEPTRIVNEDRQTDNGGDTKTAAPDLNNLRSKYKY